MRHFAHILRRRCTDRKSGALSCRLMHSCSGVDRHMQHAVFHTIAFLAFSCLAFSTAATWCRIFMSRNFMSLAFSASPLEAVFACLGLGSALVSNQLPHLSSASKFPPRSCLCLDRHGSGLRHKCINIYVVSLL